MRQMLVMPWTHKKRNTATFFNFNIQRELLSCQAGGVVVKNIEIDNNRLFWDEKDILQHILFYVVIL